MTTRPALASLRAALVLLLALVASGVCTTRAAAQGTDGLLADPISTRELTTYADMLHLSPEQLVAIEVMHDDYKRAYAALRDGPIAEFMESTRVFQGQMPTRDTIVTWLRDFDSLNGRIRGLDESLFDRMQGVLSEEQAAIMPRTRLRRERARYIRQPMLQMTGRSAVDVSELVNRLDLSDEETDTIDPILFGYEQRFTSQMRDLGEDMSRFILKIFDAFIDAGLGDLTEEDMADPEVQQQMMEVQRTAMTEIFGDAAKRMTDLADYSERTVTLIVPHLSEKHGRQLQADFYRTAYPELGMFIYANLVPGVADAIEATEPEQHGAIREILEPAHARLDGLFKRALKLTKEQRSNNVLQMDQEAMQAYQLELQELQTEATEISTQAMVALNETIEPETAIRLQRVAMQRASGQPVEGEGAETVVETRDPEDFVWSGDAFVASRITRRDLHRYARALDLDETQRIVLDELYNEYLEAYQQSGLAQRTQEAAQALWQVDPQSNVTRPGDDKAIDDLARVRREVTAAMRDLDEAFFDDVASTLTSEDDADRMARVRRHRETQVYRLSNAQWYGLGGNRAAQATVDLTDLIVTSTEQPELPDAAEVILTEHEIAALAAYKRRYEAILDFQTANERWSAASQRAYQETGNFDQSNMYMTTVQPAQDRINVIDDELAALNESTLTQLIEALPAEMRTGVRLDYNRKAFPTVYDDPVSVTRHLTSALELDDVTDAQREALVELIATYRPAYDDFSLQLIEIDVSRRPAFATEAVEDWREWQERRQQAERVRFERDELSYRAINRLRMILTEEQILLIGGLPVGQAPS